MSPYCLLLCIFLQCLLKISADNCQHGWSYFNGSCYYFADVEDSWYNSVEDCSENNAHLLRIESKHESDYITLRLKGRQFDDYIFTDGTDELHEGKWVWLSTQEKLEFTNWYPKEPKRDTNLNCIAIAPTVAESKWVAVNCDKHFRYICETDTSSGSSSAEHLAFRYLIELLTPENLSPEGNKNLKIFGWLEGLKEEVLLLRASLNSQQNKTAEQFQNLSNRTNELQSQLQKLKHEDISFRASLNRQQNKSMEQFQNLTSKTNQIQVQLHQHTVEDGLLRSSLDNLKNQSTKQYQHLTNKTGQLQIHIQGIEKKVQNLSGRADKLQIYLNELKGNDTLLRMSLDSHQNQSTGQFQNLRNRTDQLQTEIRETGRGCQKAVWESENRTQTNLTRIETDMKSQKSIINQLQSEILPSVGFFGKFSSQFSSDKTAIFRNLSHNDGNGYSTSDGKFYCPHSGQYIFSASMEFSVPFGVFTILKNGQILGQGEKGTWSTARGTGSLTVMARLGVGDVVWVKVDDTLSVGWFSYFSGALISK